MQTALAPQQNPILKAQKTNIKTIKKLIPNKIPKKAYQKNNTKKNFKKQYQLKYKKCQKKQYQRNQKKQKKSSTLVFGVLSGGYSQESRKIVGFYFLVFCIVFLVFFRNCFVFGIGFWVFFSRYCFVAIQVLMQSAPCSASLTMSFMKRIPGSRSVRKCNLRGLWRDRKWTHTRKNLNSVSKRRGCDPA